MHTADWYFDVISPFAYLQLVRFDRLPDDLRITYRPILFAGLLGHWGHKGPAEIEAKRLHTYRFSQWRADREGVRLRYPPVHPFNPLKALRLCIARGCDAATVRAVFDHIWRDGIGIDSEAGWRALAERLGVDDADALVSAPEVKDGLRRSTEEAIAAGIYGVPTFRVGGELFWGDDATAMMLDYLTDPHLFETGEFKRVSHLPAGTHRKGVESGGT